MFYVYILLCSNGNRYVGFSGNLKSRLKEHERGKVKSTKDKRPVRLIYYEAHLDEFDARRRERYLKTSNGRRALKLMTKNSLNKIIEETK